MTQQAVARRMTSEEFLALPDDGIERELIRGVVKDWGKRSTVSRRSHKHARAAARTSFLLSEWLRTQPIPCGEILLGAAAFQFSAEFDSNVGIDVAYVSAELASASDEDAFDIEGPPTLAVEVLSPSDRHRDIVEKIELYLDSGVSLVWVIDPDLRVVHVHRPNEEPVSFNMRQELTAEPHLPGFRIAVASLFV